MGSFPDRFLSGRVVILSSHRRLPHMAVLVLLPAAARAGIVAANAFAAVADRFGLLVALLAIGDSGFLLAANALPVAGDMTRGRLVYGRANRPHRFLERLRFLHAENSVGDLILHALPHDVE